VFAGFLSLVKSKNPIYVPLTLSLQEERVKQKKPLPKILTRFEGGGFSEEAFSIL
jgi:hypothetical protein